MAYAVAIQGNLSAPSAIRQLMDGSSLLPRLFAIPLLLQGKGVKEGACIPCPFDY